jgi:hypothetical protein
MALASTTVWEIRTTGATTNGGGFNSALGGTDYSQQAAAQLTLTDCTTSGAASTTLTSATGGFTAAMVGNLIYVASGTNFSAGFYQINTYTDTNNVVLDSSPTPGGAGSGGNVKVGGAQLDLQEVFDALSAGHIVWIGGGTYTLTTTLHLNKAGTSTSPIQVIGYDTTRGDAIEPSAFLDGNGMSATVLRIGINNTYSYIYVENIKAGNTSSAAGYAAFQVYGYETQYTRCTGFNVGGAAFLASSKNNVRFYGCEAYGWNTKHSSSYYGFDLASGNGCGVYECFAHDGAAGGTTIGFHLYTSAVAVNCIAARCTWGFRMNNTNANYRMSLRNCIAYDNTSRGLYSNSSLSQIEVINCIFVNNGTYGIEEGTANARIWLESVYHYGNTSGVINSTGLELARNQDPSAQLIALSGDPFRDGANNDFRLNKGVTLADGSPFYDRAWPNGFLNEGSLIQAYNTPGPTGRPAHRRRT